jgi:uncharacterized protein YkwD
MPSFTKILTASFASIALIAPAAASAHTTGTCNNANTPVAQLPSSDAKSAVVCLVNQQRKAHHLPTLSVARRLDKSAQAWTNAMLATHNFNHFGAGTTPASRIQNAGYDWMAAGENIATGYITPNSVVTAWMHSPEHCRNILDPNFTNVGTGIDNAAISGAGATFTQDFGTPMSHRPMDQNWSAADAICR